MPSSSEIEATGLHEDGSVDNSVAFVISAVAQLSASMCISFEKTGSRPGAGIVYYFFQAFMQAESDAHLTHQMFK